MAAAAAKEGLSGSCCRTWGSARALGPLVLRGGSLGEASHRVGAVQAHKCAPPRERVLRSDVVLHYVSTKCMADFLTKPLPREAFEKFRLNAGVK